MVRYLFAFSLIVGVASVIYSNSFQVPFHFDDRPNISQNPNIQIEQLTGDRLTSLIKNSYKESLRIFSFFTFALNFYFGGLDVFGYHLVNLIIHILSGVFLYWFILLTFQTPFLRERYGSTSFPIALLTSLIFIVHPIQTQSVTYIVQRMASMAGMFYLLSFSLYIKGRITKGSARFLFFGGGILTYLLGFFSKENVAILPLFVALFEFYFFQNFDLSPKGKKVAFSLLAGLLILLGLGFLFLGERYLKVVIEGYKFRSFTMGERVLTQFRVVLFYLTLLVYPHPSRLNLDHDFLLSKSLLDPPSTLISLLIIVGLIGFSLWKAKENPLLSFFTLWYFGNLMIESSIFPLEMVFEHRLYLPSVGPFFLFSLLVFRWIERWGMKTKWIWVVPFLIIIPLSLGTYQRNSVWKSELELWRDCVQKSPHKGRSHHNLGFVYYEMGWLDEAQRELEKSLRLDPNYALSWYNLGLVAYKKGFMDKAIDYYKKSIELDPTYPESYFNLGLAYYRKGLYEEAIGTYKKFLEMKPDYRNAHLNLGLAYGGLKRWEEALLAFEEERKKHPDNYHIDVYLGFLYRDMGDWSKALIHFKKALDYPNLPHRDFIKEMILSIERAQQTNKRP